MIYALSNAGADPNVPDVKGNTPLHEAFIQGFIDNKYDLIQVLLSKNAKLIRNSRSKQQQSLLTSHPCFPYSFLLNEIRVCRGTTERTLF
jgi:ankyrin repeat protein